MKEFFLGYVDFLMELLLPMDSSFCSHHSMEGRKKGQEEREEIGQIRTLNTFWLGEFLILKLLNFIMGKW